MLPHFLSSTTRSFLPRPHWNRNRISGMPLFLYPSALSQPSCMLPVRETVHVALHVPFGIQTFINACQNRFSSIQQHSARLVHGTLLEPLHVTYHFLSCMCQPAPSEVALIARATRHPTLGFSHVSPKLQQNHATSACSATISVVLGQSRGQDQASGNSCLRSSFLFTLPMALRGIASTSFRWRGSWYGGSRSRAQARKS